MIVLKIIWIIIWSQSNLEGIISFHCLDEDYWLTTEETDHSCLRENVAYSGNDINYDCDYQPLTWKRQTPIECIALCQEISECSHFTWIDPNVEKVWVSGQRRCCLKSRTKSYSEIPMKGRISGSKYCGKCSIALPPWFYDNFWKTYCMLHSGSYFKFSDNKNLNRHGRSVDNVSKEKRSGRIKRQAGETRALRRKQCRTIRQQNCPAG